MGNCQGRSAKGKDDDKEVYQKKKSELQENEKDDDEFEDSDSEIPFEDYEFPFENIVFEGGGNKALAYCGGVRVSQQPPLTVYCPCYAPSTRVYMRDIVETSIHPYVRAYV